tara:strand:- start:52 stop:477 length:426 start_codon:yes stop_codon:yes gene_type:complete
MEYVFKIKRTRKTHKTHKTRKTRKKPKPEAAAAAAHKETAAAPPTAAAAAAKFEDEFDRFFLKETAQSIDDPDEFDRIFLKETATANADSLNQELKRVIETIPIAKRIKYLQQTVDAFVQEDPFLAEQVLQQTIQTIRLIP